MVSTSLRGTFSQVASLNPDAEQVGRQAPPTPNRHHVAQRQTETFMSKDALWKDCDRHFRFYRGEACLAALITVHPWYLNQSNFEVIIRGHY